ncbi:MAG: SCO family protein [Mariprofundaceae bacterium]
MNKIRTFFCIVAVMLLQLLALAPVHASGVVASTHGLEHESVSSSQFDDKTALKRSQAVIGDPLKDYRFDLQDGAVQLADFRGKPLLINFVYSTCRHTCPMITQHLASMVKTANDTFGEDRFNVLTIGFDARQDSPLAMKVFASKQGVSGISNWQFLSAGKETIKGVSDNLGFLFYPSPTGFDHLAQTSLIDANGIIVQQIYGVEYEPIRLMQPLKNLVYNRKSIHVGLGGLFNNIRLWCTYYDPGTDAYRFDYSVFIGMTIGGIILIVLGTIIVRAFLRLGKDERI